MKDGDCAGLVALQKYYGYVGIKVAGQAKSIVMASAGNDSLREWASVPLSAKTVHLRISCDFRNQADRADFDYSLDGKKWIAIGKPLKLAYTLPHFMGYRFGLFNFATQSTGGSADFDYFRLGDTLPN